MTDSERITVRIPAEKLKALQELVDKGKFPTISDAIRAALDSFVEKHFTPDYSGWRAGNSRAAAGLWASLPRRGGAPRTASLRRCFHGRGPFR